MEGIESAAKLAKVQSPLEGELSRQDKAIEVLRTDLLLLGEKLSPVMNLEDSTPSEDTPDSYGSSQLVRNLHSNNNAIEQISRTVRELTRGIEV